MKYSKPFITSSIGLFLIFTYISGRLPYYIHPHYHLFTGVMGLVLSMVGILGIMFTSKGDINFDPKPSKVTMSTSLLLLLIVVLGTVMVPDTLSPQTAVNRGIASSQTNNSFTNLSVKDAEEKISLFGIVDSSTYSIADWNTFFSINPEPSKYVGKKVKVQGFVTNTTEEIFTLSRFVITCCAVDAVTVSLNINQSPDNPVSFDDWLIVEGVFGLKNKDNERILIVNPTTISKIPEPSDPYYF